MSELPVHVVIPDTQVKPDVPQDHLRWIGQYIVDRYAGNDRVQLIHLGDHAHMDSLSSYDEGKQAMENRRYQDDIDVANQAFAVLNKPIADHNRVRKQYKEKQWKPGKHVLLGNHEDRITRFVQAVPKLEGKCSTDDLDFEDWQVHPFLQVLQLDGIAYSHYFYNPNSGRPYTAMAETRLKQIGHSFTQGHQQGLQQAQRSFLGRRQRALIAGSCYLHNEEYRGPQAADEWRGILVCHEVQDGNYDLMEVSLDYLCRRYEGVPLSRFLVQKEMKHSA